MVTSSVKLWTSLYKQNWGQLPAPLPPALLSQVMLLSISKPAALRIDLSPYTWVEVPTIFHPALSSSPAPSKPDPCSSRVDSVDTWQSQVREKYRICYQNWWQNTFRKEYTAYLNIPWFVPPPV
jgi:hypothetical protein